MRKIIIVTLLTLATSAFAAEKEPTPSTETANTNSPVERENTRKDGAMTERKDPSSTAFKKHRGDAARGRQTKAKSSSTEEPVSPSQVK